MNDIEKAIEYWKEFKNEIDNMLEEYSENQEILKVLNEQIDPTELAIKALEKQLNSGWNNLTDDEESYPEAFKMVMFTNGSEIFIGYCDPYYEWTSTNGEDGIDVDGVVMWKPLPEHYKEEN